LIVLGLAECFIFVVGSILILCVIIIPNAGGLSIQLVLFVHISDALGALAELLLVLL
jgi:hypothetical protein